MARLANDSDRPNLSLQYLPACNGLPRRAFLVAVSEIAAGTELMWDYGVHYPRSWRPVRQGEEVGTAVGVAVGARAVVEEAEVGMTAVGSAEAAEAEAAAESAGSGPGPDPPSPPSIVVNPGSSGGTRKSAPTTARKQAACAPRKQLATKGARKCGAPVPAAVASATAPAFPRKSATTAARKSAPATWDRISEVT